ncbi:hypothetical protein [Bradyrhizobium sp. USDA 4451]
MEWWFYALVAMVLIGCLCLVRARRRSSSSREDEELNQRIDERVDRLRDDLARRDRDRDS